MPAGRPRIFESPEQMEAMMNDYIETHRDRLTMAGLCNALGIPRQTLHEYEKREEFSDIVKSARQHVEQRVEESLLYDKNQTGAIFWLKNHAGYVDKTDHQHSGPDGGPVVIERTIVDP